MKNGYYLAKRDQFFGDEEYSEGLKSLYEKHTKHISEDEKPLYCDGVSRYDYTDKDGDGSSRIKTVLISQGEVKEI